MFRWLGARVATVLGRLVRKRQPCSVVGRDRGQYRRPHLWDVEAYPQVCRYCLQTRTTAAEAQECPKLTLK